MAKQREKQLELKAFTHGGSRKGAGRPRTSGRVSHVRRDVVKARFPMHITVRLHKGVPTLRSKSAFRLFRNAVLGARAHGLNVLEFAVLGNHFHLMLESSGNESLHRAMKSLNIRLARSLNLAFKRHGAVIEDRYDLKILRTPTQVRNALIYIFANAAKHFKRPQVFDWYNSFPNFPETKRLARCRKDLDWALPKSLASIQTELHELLSDAQSWLATVGWQRAPT